MFYDTELSYPEKRFLKIGSCENVGMWEMWEPISNVYIREKYELRIYIFSLIEKWWKNSHIPTLQNHSTF